MSKYYHAKKIIMDDHVVYDGYLEVSEEGLFQQVVTEPRPGIEIDERYQDLIIAPGLVDTHIHGYAGYDVMDKDAEGLQAISEGLLTCGVTSWLPTTLTDSRDNLNEAATVVGNHYQDVTGAKIRGIFFEGPFFTEEYKGAQNPAYMSDPSLEAFDHWQDLSNHTIRKIALAPEREGVIDFIHEVTDQDVAVALAHSAATYEEARTAVEAGASIFIHTYNGMSGLHHREPGMVGAALTLDSAYTEVIADGHHIHPAAIEVILKAKPSDKVVLVTDCMRAGGQGEGESSLGEFAVMVKDGAARMVDGGSLAGSILELIQGVQNLVAWGLTSLEEAVRMASLNAARSVDIDNVCGSIRPGLEADFIVLDDRGQLQATYLNGQCRYSIF